MKKIVFNVPPFLGDEIKYMKEAATNHRICGDGPFTAKCNGWFEERLGAKKVLLTTSGSHALEMAALLCNISPGDEVILPSYTFSSTANAFILAGAVPVFVDIRPDTMNIDEKKIEEAITKKTRVIVVVHYAGVSCEMDTIIDIAKRHDLLVVEDAAQAVMSTYKGRNLGTIGDFGCFSFHETKNFSMGEGGAILVNDGKSELKAEIIREKGTNRSQFFRGQVAKYNWVDYGSSYLPSELGAAYLWGQLQHAEKMQADRMKSWKRYYEAFLPLQNAGKVILPVIPEGCVHNAHMFYLKCRDLSERTAYIDHMKKEDIMCVFHYVPLHSAPAGLKYGRISGSDEYTTKESERLVRLPLYYGLTEEDRERVIAGTLAFWQ